MPNFRMTRTQYLWSLVAATVATVKPKRERYQGVRVKPKDWAWSLDGRGGMVSAFTRSEARARIKQALGIRKGRLPIGACINCVGVAK